MFCLLEPEAVERFLAKLRACGQVHGSELDDILVEFAEGNPVAGDRASVILAELQAAGTIVPVGHQDPNHSQRAFMGLTYGVGGYRRLCADFEATWPNRGRSADNYTTLHTDVRSHYWYQLTPAYWQKEQEMKNGKASSEQAPKTATPPAKAEPVKRAVVHELTDTELVELGQETAQLEARKRQLESELAETSKFRKDEIKGIQRNVQSLLMKIGERKEMRDTDCLTWIDDDRKVRVTVRADTNEVVFERELNMEERQKSFDDVQADGVPSRAFATNGDEGDEDEETAESPKRTRKAKKARPAGRKRANAAAAAG